MVHCSTELATEKTAMADTDKLTIIANIVASYLRRNTTGADQIGAVISSVTDALELASKKIAGTTTEDAQQPQSASVAEKPQPAVSIKKSVQPEYIVCHEDGKHARTLKRHLQTAHGMTPQQYREKWRLAKDYPMVAPAYSAQRSKMAKAVGVGQKISAAKAAGPKRRGRKASANNASAQAT